MYDQISGSTQLKALGEVQTPRWQARAVEAYERSLPSRRANLRADLATRLLALTQRRLPLEDIYADAGGRLAIADVSGATFRLWHRGGETRILILVRPCAYCGTGHFESPEIRSLEDLGYALSAWRPLHEDCEDYSSEELPDF